MISYQQFSLKGIMSLEEKIISQHLLNAFVMHLAVSASGLSGRLRAVLQVLSSWNPQRIQGKPKERPQWNH